MPPKHDKPPELREKLEARLKQCFMFQALPPDETLIVLDAMQHVLKKAGEAVIKEGEDGDVLYMIEKGKLACTKVLVSYSALTNFGFRKQVSSRLT